MNNIKMLLEEILPFYFLLMILVIMFTGHTPTTFELYIVYGFGFGVSVFNNRLFQSNVKLRSFGKEAVDLVDELEEENVFLRRQLKDIQYKLEVISNENNRTSLSNNSNDFISKDY
jgi:hypothetical protein